MARLEPEELEASLSLDSCNDRPKVAKGKQSAQIHQRDTKTNNDATKEKNSALVYEYHSVDDDSASLMWVPFQSVDDEFLQDQHSSFISDECFPADVSDELTLASSDHLNLNDADEGESAPQKNDTEKVEPTASDGSLSKAEVVCKSNPPNSRIKRSRSKPDEGQPRNNFRIELQAFVRSSFRLFLSRLMKSCVPW